MPFASDMVESLSFSCPVDLHNSTKASWAPAQASVTVVESSLFPTHPVCESGGVLIILMPNINNFVSVLFTLCFPIIEFQNLAQLITDDPVDILRVNLAHKS